MATLLHKVIVNACDCPANKIGCCWLPWRAQARDRKTGGWWVGHGNTVTEAIVSALKLECQRNGKLIYETSI